MLTVARPCCDDERAWWERMEEAMEELMVTVRRVGGRALVDVPDGPRGVRHGDEVAMPEERAHRFAGTGEWELVADAPAGDEEDG